MKKILVLTILTVFVFAFFFLNLSAGEEKVVDKTFKPAELVKIKIVSGDCVVKKGTSGEIKVHLVYTYPDDKYKPVFEEQGNTLVLKEEFPEKSCNVKGTSSWTVTAPEKTDIDFKAASGDFTVTGLKSAINAKTASGDIEVKEVQGKLSAKTASGDINVEQAIGEAALDAASGDIEIKDAEGALKVNCVSGDIKASGIMFKDASSLKAVSGNLVLQLAKTNEYDLVLATVSGNVILDYNGNPIKGYFLFKGQKGHIYSDIPFDNGEESHDFSPFVKKYFKKGGDSPQVTLKTVSGKLTLKK